MRDSTFIPQPQSAPLECEQPQSAPLVDQVKPVTRQVKLPARPTAPKPARKGKAAK